MIYKSTVTFQKLYHYAVGMVRQDSGSTSMGFAKALAETFFMFAMVMGMMLLMRGIGAGKIRGEFGFFVLSGIGPFLLHNKIVGSLLDSSNKNPMLPVMAITQGMMALGNVLHTVYMQFTIMLILFFVLVIYYGGSPVFDWNMVVLCFVLTIFWSIAIGVLFMAVSPLNPYLVKKLSTVYRRLGIFTSGKMIPGNTMAVIGRMHGLFALNPLFHIIDQMRGGTFQHYVPNSSNLIYPVQMSIAVLMISSIIYFALRNR